MTLGGGGGEEGTGAEGFVTVGALGLLTVSPAFRKPAG